jgi:manganese/zinc/iron transport system permease protein
MSDLTAFFQFQDPNVRYVTAGTMLLGFTAGVIGNFLVLRKRSLAGDAIAHAALPGIVLGYMLAGGRNIAMLAAGALVAGWLALWLIDRIQSWTKLGTDTALGVVLSGFFGMGMMFLSMLQDSGRGDLAGLQTFLFGQAASLVPADVQAFSVLCGVVLLTLAAAYHPLLAFTFDDVFSKVAGIRTGLLRALVNTLIVLVVVAGLQTAGVVLISAMLIIPAVAARQWSDRFLSVLMISGFVGALAGLAGSLASFLAGDIPTGPMMVLAALVQLVFSMLFAPRHGWLVRSFRSLSSVETARRENTLKALYRLEENDRQPDKVRTLREIARAQLHHPLLWIDLLRLRLAGKIHAYPGRQRGWVLTDTGRKDARRLVRLHRLWERYLTERVRLDPDHVHDSAETFEHILTPELEEKLISQLNRPPVDPHHSPIPYEENSRE